MYKALSFEYLEKNITSSVSTELLQGFARDLARDLARIAFLQNTTSLAINMKVTW